MATRPEVTEKSILAAMREFDRELRNAAEWRGWEENNAHRYAIVHENRRYPVKKIVSIASGVAVAEFSGGRHPGHANRQVEAVGFKVVPLRDNNPDWVRDELILALDLYLKHRPNPPDKASNEITGLSRTLQRLGQKLFPPSERGESFRNANGVYMKLMNFRRLDPQYTSGGKKGLTRGAKGEEEVWAEFAHDPARCEAVANAIVASLHDKEIGGPELPDQGEDVEEATEGKLLTRKHLARERNRKLVASKRRQTLRKFGKLQCEACGFDFAARYGARGMGFIECHHTKPVASLGAGSRTHINDLALVCSNCHRMIHRARPWLTVDELRRLIA